MANPAQASAQRAKQSEAIDGTEVRALLAFNVAPERLHRIELWGVRWQSLDRQPVALRSNVPCQNAAAMSGQPVPQQDDRAAAEVPLERAKKGHQRRSRIWCAPRLKIQAHTTPVPPERQRRGDRHPLPVIQRVRQDRRVPARRPGASDDGLLREPTLVFEDEPRPPASGVFFTWGQRRRTHCRIAALSRSRARFAGRCNDHLSPCRMRHTCAGWCRTPVNRSSTVAMRGSVHRSVPNPWAIGPRRSATSSPARCSAFKAGLRPNRPAAFSPVLPSACQAWNQRWAATTLTPSLRATADWDSPRANSRAASKRRASNAATAPRVGMPQHGILPEKYINLFGKDH
jgi:hypothetical protein